MSDILDIALRSASAHGVQAYSWLFLGGLVTSIGPCAAPRYIAAAALAHAGGRPIARPVAFAVGLVGGYVALGTGVSSVAYAWSGSRLAYGVLAGVLAIVGVLTLIRTDRHACRTDALPASMGGACLLGASSTLVASPCCTPVVAALAAVTTAHGRIGEGAALMACFALGHCAPLLVAATLSRRSSSFFRVKTASYASAVVGGTLMLALAAYFGILA